jgi:hypothetical protein
MVPVLVNLGNYYGVIFKKVLFSYCFLVLPYISFSAKTTARGRKGPK